MERSSSIDEPRYPQLPLTARLTSARSRLGHVSVLIIGCGGTAAVHLEIVRRVRV